MPQRTSRPGWGPNKDHTRRTPNAPRQEPPKPAPAARPEPKT